ncbi:MAG: XRE family transcriptional regulator [Bryobacteraceae bacterium]
MEIEALLAARLESLRRERGWSLEQLANQCGISRATLSRIERGELSPTAAMLGRLCTVYGWTLSRLLAAAEGEAPDLVRDEQQAAWSDPETGYSRRAVSPPGRGLQGELVVVTLPAGSSVGFEDSPSPGLEHHLWVMEGELKVTAEAREYRLEAGDCLRYRLRGGTRFESGGGPARYLIAIVHEKR